MSNSGMRIGFDGLGIMGRPMAANLLKAGYQLMVFDHHQEHIDELTEKGAAAATCGRDLSEFADLVITMLPNSPNVKDAVFGKDGIAEGMKEDRSVLIDMSSIDPVESRSIAKALSKIGADMLDAPVSGGEPKAIDGTISIMVGGKEESFNKYKEVLAAMGKAVTYIGPIGAGNVAKLANQMIVAANIGAVSEAFTFVKKAGTDPAKVFEAIRGGLAGSTVMDAKVPMMLAGNYNPGFRCELHVKDLTNALNAAHAINMPVPLTAFMMEVFQELVNHGEGKRDHDDIVRYYERLSGVSIKTDEQKDE